MARSSKPTATPTPEPVTVPDVADDTVTTYHRKLDTLLTTASQNSRLGIEIKEQLGRLLRERHAAIEKLIDEQIEAGLTIDDIISFSTVEMPLLPTIKTRGDRVTVEWPYKLFGPDG
jgi:hypothetical protein